MSLGTDGETSRLTRIAGYLAMLFGFLGVFAGLSGAATFIPYRVQNVQTLEIATVLTGISAIGAAASAAGLVAGWGLLRGRAWAWRADLGAAIGCVATVAAFAVAMPASTPSPVPGGIPATGFLAVVAAAYGLEILILFLGRGPRKTNVRVAGGA